MERATAALSLSELVLGRYRPLKPLGSGSSGSVWLARDERTGLDVALKIVAREGRAGERAEREAEAARRLRHAHCQRIYEHAADSRHVYIVYEYIPGSTLREATRAGRLSDAQSIEAAAQVLEGLAHAHARGIVHRDVKPANVLLTDAPEISIRLLDFGLARFAQADTLTAVGDVPGTLAYIAPERLHGEAASPASDVWAVGVMLWESLAGRHPFWAASLVATSEKIAAGPPSLSKARPDLPKPLVTAVDRALDADPMRRPPAAELAKRLRQVWKEAPRPAPRPSRPADAQSNLPARVIPAVLAALFAGWTAATLPFYPTAWPVLLALAAALLTFFSARGGLAFALLVPFFPLGNISLGLSLLYGAAATAWFLLHARDPRVALAFVIGPLLAPVAALALLPLALQPVRRGWRRALQAATAVVVAGLVAGLQQNGLPFGAGRVGPLGLDGERNAFGAAAAIRDVLVAHPVLGLEAVAFAVAAALLPFARRHGLWGVAAFGGASMAAFVLVAPQANAVPAVLGVWLTCVALGAWNKRAMWLPRARPLFASAPTN